MKRLDKIVTEIIPGLSRAKARELCLAGEVLVKGKAREPGFMVLDESTVQVLSQPKEITLDPELVERTGGVGKFIVVIFEDKDILILEKPRLMHSVRQKADDDICLADCIAAYLGAKNAVSNNPLEAGLVNRLDYSTSGLILAAKNDASWQNLHEQLKSDQTTKTYFALVEGKPEIGSINIPIELVKNAKKVKTETARNLCEAKSKITEVELHGEFSLVTVSAKHLVRHQIRAHLSAIGCPLVGDSLYGSSHELPKGIKLGDKKVKPEGFLLHSKAISLSHPSSSKPLTFSSKKKIDLSLG